LSIRKNEDLRNSNPLYSFSSALKILTAKRQISPQLMQCWPNKRDATKQRSHPASGLSRPFNSWHGFKIYFLPVPSSNSALSRPQSSHVTYRNRSDSIKVWKLSPN